MICVDSKLFATHLFTQIGVTSTTLALTLTLTATSNALPQINPRPNNQSVNCVPCTVCRVAYVLYSQCFYCARSTCMCELVTVYRGIVQWPKFVLTYLWSIRDYTTESFIARERSSQIILLAWSSCRSASNFLLLFVLLFCFFQFYLFQFTFVSFTRIVVYLSRFECTVYLSWSVLLASTINSAGIFVSLLLFFFPIRFSILF